MKKFNISFVFILFSYSLHPMKIIIRNSLKKYCLQKAQKLKALKNHLFLDYIQFIMAIWNQYMLQKMAIFLFMVISIK